MKIGKKGDNACPIIGLDLGGNGKDKINIFAQNSNHKKEYEKLE